MNQPEVGTSANRTEDFSELKIGERDEDFRRDYKKNPELEVEKIKVEPESLKDFGMDLGKEVQAARDQETKRLPR